MITKEEWLENHSNWRVKKVGEVIASRDYITYFTDKSESTIGDIPYACRSIALSIAHNDPYDAIAKIDQLLGGFQRAGNQIILKTIDFTTSSVKISFSTVKRSDQRG
jgi:hypothetical protein